MMQFVSYDDALLESGKFYTVRINKDELNAVIEAPPSPIQFENKTYINEVWNGIASVEIWRVEKYGEHEKHTNITNSVEWYILKPENRIVINSNSPISGYVRFI